MGWVSCCNLIVTFAPGEGEDNLVHCRSNMHCPERSDGRWHVTLQDWKGRWNSGYKIVAVLLIQSLFTKKIICQRSGRRQGVCMLSQVSCSWYSFLIIIGVIRNSRQQVRRMVVAAVATLPAQPVEAVEPQLNEVQQPEINQQQAAKPKVVLLVNKWSQTEREHTTTILHCAL